MTTKTWLGLGTGLLALGALAMGVSAAEDDLSVVKRAVAVQADADDAPMAPVVRKSGSRRPAWLKVRIVESKGGKKEEKVSVSLPLALLALLGKDASVDLSQLGVHGVRSEEHTSELQSQ